MLRGTGIIETSDGHGPFAQAPTRRASPPRIVVCIAMTTTATAAVVDVIKPSSKADPRQDGCNGFIELCFQPLNQIVWAGSHNAMSSAAYNFFTAEHIGSVTEQLNDGARALLIDAYNGYQDHGLVRTNFTGTVNRQQVIDELGGDALRQLDRVGALTGAADTSGKKKDVYLCHLYCEVGAVKATKVFSEVNAYLNTHLTDVVILDVEDYVTPQDLENALKQGHLWDRLYHLDLVQADADPARSGQPAAGPGPGAAPGHRHLGEPGRPGAVAHRQLQLMQETPYTFDSTAQFNCNPNRGASTNPMLLVNHWLRAPGSARSGRGCCDERRGRAHPPAAAVRQRAPPAAQHPGRRLLRHRRHHGGRRHLQRRGRDRHRGVRHRKQRDRDVALESGDD